MTRPSPRPRPKAAVAKLGVTTQKSPAERLTGVADKGEPKQATFSGLKFFREDSPIGFEAAHYCKTGIDLAPANEQAARVAQPAEVES